jgi:hypothetical protein
MPIESLNSLVLGRSHRPGPLGCSGPSGAGGSGLGETRMRAHFPPGAHRGARAVAPAARDGTPAGRGIGPVTVCPSRARVKTRPIVLVDTAPI